VYPELVRLRDQGINIWYDEGIEPGAEWEEALAQRIERCATFLYFVSARSAASAHCRRELTFAHDQGCEVVTVHLEPTELSAGLRLSLGNRQAILRYELSHPPHRLQPQEPMRSPR